MLHESYIRSMHTEYAYVKQHGSFGRDLDFYLPAATSTTGSGERGAVLADDLARIRHKASEALLPIGARVTGQLRFDRR